VPALNPRSTKFTFALALGLLTLVPGQAFADDTFDDQTQNPPGTQQRGNADDDGTLSATAGAVVYDRSRNGSGSSVGAVTSATSWTPPPCYYAPKYTPAQLKAYLEPIWEVGSTGSEWDLEQRNKYESGGSKDGTYKDFNKAKTGKGYWWDSYVNGDYPVGWDSCDKDIFWVDANDDPPADIPEAITPKVLAQLAYAEIRVPSTKVKLAPEDTTKVNLPTWAWLDTAKFRPVSVTASVPLLNVTATTTAEPVSLRIEPGTADAETYPASGVCEISGDHIGEAFAKGKAKQTPPCGVRYLRSSGDGSYKLRATITWKIHWTGTGVADARDLPAGTFGADQDVVVQEIQSINR
jgi:enoyl reductase